MNTDPIKALIYADEFYPFRIWHKKGRTYDIAHREFCWVSPTGVFVVEDDGQGQRSMVILNPALIEKIQTHEEAA